MGSGSKADSAADAGGWHNPGQEQDLFSQPLQKQDCHRAPFLSHDHADLTSDLSWNGHHSGLATGPGPRRRAGFSLGSQVSSRGF